MRAMSLRYFNVAGAATPELGDTGVFNLVPMVFERLQAGERPRVFGGDYPTPDGTCVRDYVHVADIADAHLAAARALEDGAPGATYNIGRGEGSSVLDVLRVVGEVTGLDTTPDVVDRRPGDPARVVAAGRPDPRGPRLHRRARPALDGRVAPGPAGSCATRSRRLRASRPTRPDAREPRSRPRTDRGSAVRLGVRALAVVGGVLLARAALATSLGHGGLLSTT